MTTSAIPPAADGVLLRAVRRLASDALILADLQATPIFAFSVCRPKDKR